MYRHRHEIPIKEVLLDHRHRRTYKFYSNIGTDRRTSPANTGTNRSTLSILSLGFSILSRFTSLLVDYPTDKPNELFLFETSQPRDHVTDRSDPSPIHDRPNESCPKQNLYPPYRRTERLKTRTKNKSFLSRTGTQFTFRPTDQKQVLFATDYIDYTKNKSARKRGPYLCISVPPHRAIERLKTRTKNKYRSRATEQSKTSPIQDRPSPRQNESQSQPTDHIRISSNR